jgi:hypothetical protein
MNTWLSLCFKVQEKIFSEKVSFRNASVFKTSVEYWTEISEKPISTYKRHWTSRVSLSLSYIYKMGSFLKNKFSEILKHGRCWQAIKLISESISSWMESFVCYSLIKNISQCNKVKDIHSNDLQYITITYGLFILRLHYLRYKLIIEFGQ